MSENIRTGVANSRAFIETLPHAKALGLNLVSLDETGVTISMPYDEKLIGDPESGVIHGGAVSALMDTCGGAAVMTHPKAHGVAATLDLRIDYMRPATPGQTITARAHCYYVSRTVAFVRAVAFDSRGADAPVAVATGAFTMEGGAA